MSNVVEENKLLYPVTVRLIGTPAVVTRTQRFPQLVKEFGLFEIITPKLFATLRY